MENDVVGTPDAPLAVLGTDPSKRWGMDADWKLVPSVDRNKPVPSDGSDVLTGLPKRTG
jgi:hypothetical protein